jgi:hypothetical protein
VCEKAQKTKQITPLQKKPQKNQKQINKQTNKQTKNITDNSDN